MKLKIKLAEGATLPSKAHSEDAGFDLTATSMKYHNNFVEYGTGVFLEIPDGHMGLIFPRSSISKYQLSMCNSVGVIDSNYRGELMIRFTSLGSLHYKTGDRIGQLVIIPIPAVELEQVDSLDDTERSEGGFGSSGE